MDARVASDVIILAVPLLAKKPTMPPKVKLRTVPLPVVCSLKSVTALLVMFTLILAPCCPIRPSM